MSEIPVLHRIVPMTGTDAQRVITAAAELFLANELHTTRNQKRVFFSNILVGSVWQGSVVDESTMLALNATAERGCFPGDFCKRVDTETIWFCITNRGELITDWEEAGGSGGGGSSFDIRTAWLMG